MFIYDDARGHTQDNGENIKYKVRKENNKNESLICR